MRSARGFTIIEIMIVVTMIAILASIAIPSYTQYVTRSKIQEATSTLLSQRVKLEQFFQDNRTYVGACAAGTVAVLPGNAGQLQYFTITCPVLTATTYTILASGGGATDQSMANFVYSIDQANTRVTVGVPPGSGWTVPASNCWVTKKGGVC